MLAHVCDVEQNDEERWRLAQTIMADIHEINVKPNVSTFNALMFVAFHQEKTAADLCLKLLNEMRCEFFFAFLFFVHEFKFWE